MGLERMQWGPPALILYGQGGTKVRVWPDRDQGSPRTSSPGFLGEDIFSWMLAYGQDLEGQGSLGV